MKKIVVKISSNLLNPDHNINIIERLAEEITKLTQEGSKVIIVTSGAVMHGIKLLKYDKKPSLLPLLQSCAAIGQIQLMKRYQMIFEQYNLICGQILVSADDFRLRKRYLNLRNTVEALLSINAIPIFNENDSINTDELKFGDNDHLSALITIMMNFDLLVILTNVDGLYDKDPTQDSSSQLISRIDDMNHKYLSYAGNKISKFTTGGMKTKLESTLKATTAGVDVFIGHGLKTSLTKIINNEETGTYIHGTHSITNAKKKWLGLSPTTSGSVTIDKGAYQALNRNSSLLASGIVGVNGNFNKGSLISIIYTDKKIAQGLTNYSSKEIELIKGKKSSEFNLFIKHNDYEEVIHKNNMCLI